MPPSFSLMKVTLRLRFSGLYRGQQDVRCVESGYPRAIWDQLPGAGPSLDIGISIYPETVSVRTNLDRKEGPIHITRVLLIEPRKHLEVASAKSRTVELG